MCENFIIMEDINCNILSLHFVFAVNYVHDKNVLYGMQASYIRSISLILTLDLCLHT